MIHAHAEAVKNIKNAAGNNLSFSKQQPLVLLKQTQNKIALKHSFHIRSLKQSKRYEEKNLKENFSKLLHRRSVMAGMICDVM